MALIIRPSTWVSSTSGVLPWSGLPAFPSDGSSITYASCSPVEIFGEDNTITAYAYASTWAVPTLDRVVYPIVWAHVVSRIVQDGLSNDGPYGFLYLSNGISLAGGVPSFTRGSTDSFTLQNTARSMNYPNFDKHTTFPVPESILNTNRITVGASAVFYHSSGNYASSPAVHIIDAWLEGVEAGTPASATMVFI